MKIKQLIWDKEDPELFPLNVCSRTHLGTYFVQEWDGQLSCTLMEANEDSIACPDGYACVLEKPCSSIEDGMTICQKRF